MIMTVFVADARISRACHNTTFVLMLSLIFLIRGVLSSFPLSEILPPEGKLKIFAHESKAKLVSEMAQQPAWHSVNDRTSDIEGYLFISTPADACKVVLSPPKFPTPNWILLAETGRCSNQRKASKAFERGYKAIIIFSSESNETGWQDSAPFELPTFFVGEKEARNLRHNFSYPGLYYVQIEKADLFWAKVMAYSIWSIWAFVTMTLSYFLLKCLIKACLSNCDFLLAINIFHGSRNKCEICKELLPLRDGHDLMDRLYVLPCLHRFHAFCMFPYATPDGTCCPTCGRIFEFFGQEDRAETRRQVHPSP